MTIETLARSATIRSILREPLLHFLLLGAGIFFVYYTHNRGAVDLDDSRTIVVDGEKLATFAQYRSPALNAAPLRTQLNALPPEQLQRMIQDYVREEALYREAKSLKLDEKDHVLRLRMIQQLEFITRGFVDEQVRLTEPEIQRYYEQHKDTYRVAPRLTFAHVFFSEERHGAAQAQALARAELRKLNRDRIPFDQASAHGERFLYQVNYVNRDPDDVASHFGKEMQVELFGLEPNRYVWRGPLKSLYGFHVVLLTRNEPGYLPSLEEVRAKVEREARHDAVNTQFEESIQSIVKRYEVEVEPIQRAKPFFAKTL